ncbi:hypothetical protein [Cochlodiniinecator piscidefendens]|uniref:hypothetical protein n=1 Tax=Cochlodiniinecator piscidefendens TaxID=2715756 RepID=UPI00140D7859|nr:hypothetical protein [Cochlodiniinecator piscidefendens]
MVDPITSRLWLMRALFLAMSIVLIFAHLVPLRFSSTDVEFSTQIELTETGNETSEAEIARQRVEADRSVLTAEEVTPTLRIAPDILLAITLCWLIRRPRYVPVFLIGLVFLMTDLLLMRPPGLMAALVVLTTEFLRARLHLLRELPFLFEWGVIGGAILVVFIADRSMLSLALTGTPTLSQTLVLALTTWAVYPIVTVVSKLWLGFDKMTSGELTATGQHT